MDDSDYLEVLSDLTTWITERRQYLLREIAMYEQKIKETRELLSNPEFLETRPISMQNLEKEFNTMVRDALCEVADQRKLEITEKFNNLTNSVSNLLNDTETVLSKLNKGQESAVTQYQVKKNTEEKIKTQEYHNGAYDALMSKISKSEAALRAKTLEYEKIRKELEESEERTSKKSREVEALSEKIQNCYKRKPIRKFSIIQISDETVNIMPSLRTLIPERRNIQVLAPIRNNVRRGLRL